MLTSLSLPEFMQIIDRLDARAYAHLRAGRNQAARRAWLAADRLILRRAIRG